MSADLIIIENLNKVEPLKVVIDGAATNKVERIMIMPVENKENYPLRLPVKTFLPFEVWIIVFIMGVYLAFYIELFIKSQKYYRVKKKYKSMILFNHEERACEQHVVSRDSGRTVDTYCFI